MNVKSTKLRTIEIYSVLVTDLIVVLVSYFIAHYLKMREYDVPVFRMDEMYVAFLLVALILSLLYTIIVNPSHDFTNRGYIVEFVYVSKYVICEIAIMACMLFALKYADTFSRLMFGYYCVLLEIMTYVAHLILKRYIRRYYRSEKNQTKLLVITDRKHMEDIENTLGEKMDILRGVAGTVIWDGEDGNEYGNKNSYKEKVKLLAIDEVFIYLPDTARKEITDIISFFETMGVVCNYGIDIDGIHTANTSIDTLGGYTVISYSVNVVDYNKRMIKRMIDILGGLVGSIITIIITPFIALAIVIDNPGPVFFKQKRVGRNGRMFYMYKFRSMCKDAEQKKAQLQESNEMDGLMFKMENDPRITKVGAFLRKTSLDEFPQFFNILMGDMSLVGTRPPTIDEYEQYDAHYKRRLSIKPGLTGMWQVSGRSDIKDFDEIVRLDLEYIDNWSVSLDLKILFKTVGAVFNHTGAK